LGALFIENISDIVYVGEGSFAWEGGLTEEDEIISVNEIPIDALGYFGIYELFGDMSIMEYKFIVKMPGGDAEEVLVPAY